MIATGGTMSMAEKIIVDDTCLVSYIFQFKYDSVFKGGAKVPADAKVPAVPQRHVGSSRWASTLCLWYQESSMVRAKRPGRQSMWWAIYCETKIRTYRETWGKCDCYTLLNLSQESADIKFSFLSKKLQQFVISLKTYEYIGKHIILNTEIFITVKWTYCKIGVNLFIFLWSTCMYRNSKI